MSPRISTTDLALANPPLWVRSKIFEDINIIIIIKLVVSAHPVCVDASFVNKQVDPSTGTPTISFAVFGVGCGAARVPVCLPWSCAAGHFPRRCVRVTTTSPHLLWQLSSALARSVHGIPPYSMALMTRMLRIGSPPSNGYTHNNWDDKLKQTNVSLLTGVAETSYKNHGGDLRTWSDFKTEFAKVFGRPPVRKQRAEQRLRERAQRTNETFTSYIEDIFDLCKWANNAVTEEGKVCYSFMWDCRTCGTLLPSWDDGCAQRIVALIPYANTAHGARSDPAADDCSV